MPRDELLKVSEVDYCQYLVRTYTPTAPTLRMEERHLLPPGDVQVDVSQDRNRAIRDRSQPFYTKGTQFTLCIPFDGDPELFHLQPAMWTNRKPQGVVRDQELHLSQIQLTLNKEQLEGEFNRMQGEIKAYLEWVAKDVAQFQTSFETDLRRELRARKERVLAQLDLASSLGIPIQRRVSAPLTYRLPDIRRKAAIRPQVPSGPFQPEPELPMEEYEHILRILNSMALVMEKSPGAFATMKEEDLRWHFLVQLNGQYEGRASGETFNFQGKTDVLLREGERNAFVAECKFWKGDKQLTDTVDQLLGYLTWRDTKTAIILFNRNQNFTLVLGRIPAVIKEHSCFKREVGQQGETAFRFVFHQPGDPNRELILTVMAFNVPTDPRPRE